MTNVSYAEVCEQAAQIAAIVGTAIEAGRPGNKARFAINEALERDGVDWRDMRYRSLLNLLHLFIATHTGLVDECQTLYGCSMVHPAVFEGVREILCQHHGV